MRALATHTAVITLIGLGLAAPASAAPGDTGSDNRSDTATTAQVEASEKGSEQSQTRSGDSTTKASGGSSTSTETKRSTQSEDKGLDDDRRTQTGEQPVSTADQNTGGANGQCSDTESLETGDYCGTDRTNKASGNGEGDGAAVGKPYQAHKGKADNKNPPGQVDNTRDNGYECDGNKGIAKGNPAHTTCVTTTGGGGGGGGGGGFTPPGPPPVTPPSIGGVDTVVPPEVTPPVKGVELYRPPAQAPEAAPAQALPGAAVLPATGAAPATTALSALAFGMLALGSGVLLYRRVTS